MKFARWTFLIAGLAGAPVILALYFLAEFLGRQLPPEINHPEIYYGFVGVTLAWQIGYIMIGLDPVRYRPLMLLAAFAKGSFVVATVILVTTGRAPGTLLPIVAPDAIFVALFLVAYRGTGSSARFER